MTSSFTAVSAPGKVLLAGGYLVLDREYTGLVFGLDARIHVVVQPLESSPGVSFQEIIVKSPQFVDAVWEYGYRQTEDKGGVQVTQLSRLSSDPLRKNPFVETALSYAFSYITAVSTAPITAARISILADDDYYSPASPSTSLPTAQQSLPKTSNSHFKHFGVSLHDAHKTGLGSSAALVTAFTAAILSYYLPSNTFSLSDPQGRQRLHNLAQAAHCAAQGKVGSGFDVASAVYGSCLYRRFSPSLLQSHGEPGDPGFAAQLRDLVEEVGLHGKWDTEIQSSAVQIPQGIRLVMCDVDCGSQTPGMVKQVLAWRKDKSEEANKTWKTLQAMNVKLASDLATLANSTNTSDFSVISTTIKGIRENIIEMSKQSGVPIEPPEQTALLDALSALPGVLGGVVPGAGGYDAVALLIEDRPAVIKQLQEFLQGFKGRENEVEGQNIGVVRMLGVREDMLGVKDGNASEYSGWV